MAAPKLRFKEFDGDWSPYVLKDFVSFRKGKGISKADISENGINECIRYGELYTTYGQVIDHIHSKTNVSKSECILSKAGDVIIPASGETQIDIATASCVLHDDIILSGDLNILSHKENGSWLAYYLSSAKKLEIAQLAQGNSVVHLYSSQLKDLKINKPSKEEQTKIASFLSNVDEKISQLTQKHALLSQYKQGMMQKLFSQQIRFKADDGSEFGEWENKTLGEVGENIIGLTYSPTDVTNDSTGILVLRSSNIKEGRLDKSDQVRVNKKIKDKIIIQPNDILICTRNGSQRLIGKSVIINDDEIMTFGAFMSVYRSDYNRFIAYLMQTPWFFEQVQMNLGARINQITTGTLNEFTFDFPCLEEQTKIANFLSAIDEKIEVVAQQIEQAKIWKKGLLQQMFV
ncbi:restriction endonuclease subunit S [Acinetobacter junii]|nr:restriction endonuclease subunit S [Acinetobacter junii]MDI9719528.1 restriction endonuclease subunit S [Acinetobacter junii]